MSDKLGSQASSEASPLAFFKRQFLKPKALPRDIQLRGKVAIVTGASSGLGLEAARQLLKLGLAHLVLAVRSQARGDAAAEKLRSEFPGATVSISLLDMESYASIQAFVARCQETLPRIDIMILNAGVQKYAFTTVAETGHETTIQINYLSTMLLAILILPVMKSKNGPDATRSPVLSFVGSDLAYNIDMDRGNADSPVLKQLDNPKTYSQMSNYSKSKLLIILAAINMAESVNRDDVLVNVTNPGMTKGTQIAREVPWALGKIVALMNALLGRPLNVAASNFVYSTVVLGKESHGAFTSDWDIKP